MSRHCLGIYKHKSACLSVTRRRIRLDEVTSPAPAVLQPIHSPDRALNLTTVSPAILASSRALSLSRGSVVSALNSKNLLCQSSHRPLQNPCLPSHKGPPAPMSPMKGPDSNSKSQCRIFLPAISEISAAASTWPSQEPSSPSCGALEVYSRALLKVHSARFRYLNRSSS
jgi:hypothetical protein